MALRMIPGGRADRAVQSVKRAGVRAAGGGALGAAAGAGAASAARRDPRSTSWRG